MNDVDPGGAGYTDVDLTATLGNMAVIAQLVGRYVGGAGYGILVRRNGETTDDLSQELMRAGQATNYEVGRGLCMLDDGQIFEYKTTCGAGTVEHVFISVAGFWEWEMAA